MLNKCFFSIFTFVGFFLFFSELDSSFQLHAQVDLYLKEKRDRLLEKAEDLEHAIEKVKGYANLKQKKVFDNNLKELEKIQSKLSRKERVSPQLGLQLEKELKNIETTIESIPIRQEGLSTASTRKGASSCKKSQWKKNIQKMKKKKRKLYKVSVLIKDWMNHHTIKFNHADKWVIKDVKKHIPFTLKKGMELSKDQKNTLEKALNKLNKIRRKKAIKTIKLEAKIGQRAPAHCPSSHRPKTTKSQLNYSLMKGRWLLLSPSSHHLSE